VQSEAFLQLVGLTVLSDSKWSTKKYIPTKAPMTAATMRPITKGFIFLGFGVFGPSIIFKVFFCFM
jgi:hypothetical protein